jgi:hypothetical protein
MTPPTRLALVFCLVTVAYGQLALPLPRFWPWSGFAGNPQHTALSPVRSQSFKQILWQTPVDLDPQFSDGELTTHYGSPLITAENTVIVPVKTAADGAFRVEAHSGLDGSLTWSMPTDYILPPHNWIPEFGPVLAAGTRLYFPGAGGTVYFRDDPDAADGPQGQVAFYGLSNYSGNQQAYNAGVMIDTPLTADGWGNLYFGFEVTGSTPLGLKSGIARIGANGVATWTAVAVAAADESIVHVVQNCAPALSSDGGTLYIAVSDADSAGYLLALNSTTLARVASVRLKDPATGDDALLIDDGTASPMVGWDGDVYYGVFESADENHDRGWLLHFDALLSHSKIPGAFGWDDTPSLVPSTMAPSYAGKSAYLLMTKYNNYVETGGDGLNKIAVLDPNDTEIDPITGATVMREVLTIAGPTADGPPPAVKEWCINSAAVDPRSGSVVVNSEDGNLYRWDLATNRFSEMLALTGGLPEAYTPTVIGPDGTVFAINNSALYAIGGR